MSSPQGQLSPRTHSRISNRPVRCSVAHPPVPFQGQPGWRAASGAREMACLCGVRRGPHPPRAAVSTRPLEHRQMATSHFRTSRRPDRAAAAQVPLERGALKMLLATHLSRLAGGKSSHVQGCEGHLTTNPLLHVRQSLVRSNSSSVPLTGLTLPPTPSFVFLGLGFSSLLGLSSRLCGQLPARCNMRGRPAA